MAQKDLSLDDFAGDNSVVTRRLVERISTKTQRFKSIDIKINILKNEVDYVVTSKGDSVTSNMLEDALDYFNIL